jgi:hypothetical protein
LQAFRAARRTSDAAKSTAALAPVAGGIDETKAEAGIYETREAAASASWLRPISFCNLGCGSAARVAQGSFFGSGMLPPPRM